MKAQAFTLLAILACVHALPTSIVDSQSEKTPLSRQLQELYSEPSLSASVQNPNTRGNPVPKPFCSMCKCKAEDMSQLPFTNQAEAATWRETIYKQYTPEQLNDATTWNSLIKNGPNPDVHHSCYKKCVLKFGCYSGAVERTQQVTPAVPGWSGVPGEQGRIDFNKARSVQMFGKAHTLRDPVNGVGTPRITIRHHQ